MMNIPTGSASFQRRNASIFQRAEPVIRPSEERESELQSRIEEMLRSHGSACYFVRQRMDKATTCPVGTPDFIGWYRGVSFAWECKVGRNKVTVDQGAALHHAKCAGAMVAVVRSLAEARERLEEIIANAEALHTFAVVELPNAEVSEAADKKR